jgi:serine-type D-Ala-D-Ala carboxypeptidase/endopeptidase (penicillin-binding protein 4)
MNLSRAAAGEPLASRLEAVMNEPRFKTAHWGALVVDLNSAEPLVEHQVDKLFAPASVTKLFSVAAALDELGANHRFETPLYAQGQIDATGKLDGNLILVASGDLNFGGRDDGMDGIAFTNSDHIYAGDRTELTAGDPLAALDQLARQAYETGLRRVAGDVVVDDRLFEHARGTGSGPDRLTPIMINDNLIDFTIAPGEEGEPAKVDWRPKSAAYQVDVRARTISAGRTDVDVASVGDGRLVVTGQISVAHKPVVRVYEVADPASFARSLLIEALERAGISVATSPLGRNSGGALPAHADYGSLKRVAQFRSPPFAQSAKLILKVSHNLHASTLPLLLASRHGERTLREGLRRQREFLIKAGVEADTLSFGGAAGGDAADYVTPRATVRLLTYLASRDDFAAYDAALPVLGIDGTLARAVKPDSRARGKVRAKTGTMFWANRLTGGEILTSKALAGYMDAANGRSLAFAIFVNNVPTRGSGDREQIGEALGRLCEIIYESE